MDEIPYLSCSSSRDLPAAKKNTKPNLEVIYKASQQWDPVGTATKCNFHLLRLKNEWQNDPTAEKEEVRFLIHAALSFFPLSRIAIQTVLPVSSISAL